MSPIEQAKQLGLDTSAYVEREGEFWCSAHDAPFVLQAVNPGKDVGPKYFRTSVYNGKIRKLLVFSPRTYVYALSDLLAIQRHDSRGMPTGIRPVHKQHVFSAEGLRKQQEAQAKRREREREAKESANS